MSSQKLTPNVMQPFPSAFHNFRVQITLPKHSMYFCQQIRITTLLVSEQLQRLWHPKVIVLFHRYCYSKGIKRNTHVHFFLDLISHLHLSLSHISLLFFPFYPRVHGLLIDALVFFSWMSSQHFRYHYSALLLSLSFFITSYCTAFESLISIFQVAHNEGFIVFYWTSCAIAVAFTMLCHREEKI